MNEIAVLPFQKRYSRLFLTSYDQVLPPTAHLFVYDENTVALFPRRDSERSLVLPAGEKAKKWESVERLLHKALTLSLGRDSVIVAIGGGVLTDLTAFAASLYMRGCRLILLPTTLLSMVDAAIGGKCGIDFAGAKNLVGTVYPAQEIRLCPALLESLPASEYRSGLAEVIKHGILAPSNLWEMLYQEREAILARDAGILEQLIPMAVKVKVDIVSQDLWEEGPRAFLNFGHTFGHALEAASDFSRWSHGEAVAWGMIKALELGERLHLTQTSFARKARDLIHSYGLGLINPQIDPEKIKAAMLNDKKKKAGRLQFIMMKKLGSPVIEEVPESVLNQVLGIV